tara:strand:- start:8629 stop:9150 length:522 start_codon:yes stop_codon:yes gene_type:complete
MDEVALMLNLIDTQWSSSATTLVNAGTITASHVAKPNLVDVRSLEKNKGVRYDLSTKDVIVCFEDSQNIEYPTMLYDVRNETYSFTLHIRCIHDERAVGGGGTDANFGKDRLRALYLILRHAIESKRKGYEASDGSCFNLLFLGSRSEANDRNKRLFGYKINVEAKRYAQTIP